MLQQKPTAMSIQGILTTIFARISVKHKWQSDFLYEMFDLIFSVQGRPPLAGVCNSGLLFIIYPLLSKHE